MDLWLTLAIMVGAIYLFVTEKLGTVPLKLPEGVDRPKYMAYKQLAKQAMPGRLREGKGER